MNLLIGLGLFAFATAHAIEFLPCQRALAGHRFTSPDGVQHDLDEGQIVVRGNLHAHWETGMEDQTGWCIFDRDTYENLSSNGYDALHNLDGGARVYLLNPAREAVVAQGFHAEELEPGTVNIRGREIPVSPNRPRLLVEPGGSRLALPNSEYAECFRSESPAVAIVRPHPNLLKHYDKTLSPLLEAYEVHRHDPSRFVSVGAGRTHERRIFETVARGTPEVRDDGRIRLRTADGPLQLIPHDRLYLISSEGAALGEVDIATFPARVKSEEIAAIRRASRVVLIQRTPRTGYAKETDF